MKITTPDELLAALNRGLEVRCRFSEESDAVNLRILRVVQGVVRFEREGGSYVNSFGHDRISLLQAFQSYRDFETSLVTEIPFMELPV